MQYPAWGLAVGGQGTFLFDIFQLRYQCDTDGLIYLTATNKQSLWNSEATNDLSTV